MKIRDLLLKDAKHRTAATIGPNETVMAAIQKLVELNRESLPVCDEEGRLVGVITEGDIERKCLVYGESYANIRVRDVMTLQLAVGTPDDDSEYAISVMKQKKIQHLPILDGQKITGMISMRDMPGVGLEETKLEFGT